MGINGGDYQRPTSTAFFQTSISTKDLDDNNQLTDLIKQAGLTYLELAQNDEVKKLTKMKYRNQLRHAIYELADEFVGE